MRLTLSTALATPAPASATRAGAWSRETKRMLTTPSRALMTGGRVFGSAWLPLPGPGSCSYLSSSSTEAGGFCALGDEVLLAVCFDLAV